MLPTRLTRFRRTGILAGLAIALLAVAALGAGGAGSVVAQDDATPTPGDGPPTVTAGGRGVVTIPPDTAVVTIGVDVFQPTLSEAQAQATSTMETVIQAILDAGVAEEDVQTTNYSVNPVPRFDNQGRQTGIDGFQVSNQVTVKVRDIDQLGELLDTAVAEGANSIYGISFLVDDPAAAASEARVAAVEDARRKAEELADAAGLSLGRVLSITEGTSPPPMPLPFGSGAADMAESAARVPVQVGTSEVAVDVQVTYELR